MKRKKTRNVTLEFLKENKVLQLFKNNSGGVIKLPIIFKDNGKALKK